MELCLQFGHGMKELSKELVRKWGSGTIIMSPRDMEPEQIERWALEFRKVNASCLFDPQIYYPKSDHHRLITHNYWPDTFTTSILSNGTALKKVLSNLKRYNDTANTSAYILPGIYSTTINQDWFAVHETIVEDSINIMNDKERYATLCIPSDCLRLNEELIEEIISRTENWDVHGYYIVAEHPNNQYLVDDPIWLSNLMILCSGLKLQNRKVIVGYCSHQMLCLASANVDCIASGTWLNVRVFGEDRFYEGDEDSTSRRAKWYYCPQALSEFKIPFLDVAFKKGVLGKMSPDVALDNQYPSILFSGALPSSTSYSEGASFKHYLHSLRYQCQNSTRDSFRETKSAHEVLLETAERYINGLHSLGIRGQERDFSNIIDVNRAALTLLEDARGFVLDRQWN